VTENQLNLETRAVMPASKQPKFLESQTDAGDSKFNGVLSWKSF